MNEKEFQDELKKLSDGGVESVRYHVTDIQGNLKEVTLTIGDIRGTGTTTTDGSSLFGKIIPPTESDMLLEPDHSTLVRIPWMDKSARMICTSFHTKEHENEEPQRFEGCPRSILAKVESSIRGVLESRVGDRKIKEFHAHFAPEVEFLLLPKDYDFLNIHRDLDLANTNYFMPVDEYEAMDEMVHALGKMGLAREKYHSEVTTHQYEIGVGHEDVLTMADATITLKYIIKEVAKRRNLKASFIPKFRQGVNGSGMHVHQNLAATLENGEKVNLFFDESRDDGLSDIGRSYIAGLLKYAPEITAITNPIPVSYKRLVPGCEAPTYIAWDWLNRTALCRGHSKGTKKIRVEYRSPDPTCNPYLAYAAMLSAGLEGIASNLQLPPPQNRDFYHDNAGVLELPGSLDKSLDNMNKSEMLRARMGDFIVDTIYKLSSIMSKECQREVTGEDIRRFF
ncbi:MAG: glutamine synthetase family protein [archaeon]